MITDRIGLHSVLLPLLIRSVDPSKVPTWVYGNLSFISRPQHCWWKAICVCLVFLAVVADVSYGKRFFFTRRNMAVNKGQIFFFEYVFIGAAWRVKEAAYWKTWQTYFFLTNILLSGKKRMNENKVLATKWRHSLTWEDTNSLHLQCKLFVSSHVFSCLAL